MTIFMFNHHIKPIRSCYCLAGILGIKLGELNSVLKDKDSYYKSNPRPKIDGGYRDTFIIRSPLKGILNKVKEKILDKVEYPHYLHGAIRERSSKTNATAHLGAVWLIKMDIKNYFPSIQREHVRQLFHEEFCFPDSVAKKLANITTYKNALPQGSPASSLISNLVLRRESDIVKFCNEKHYRYTRYVDDMAVSAPFRIKDKQKDEIKKKVSQMVRQSGFLINRRKTKIFGWGDDKLITGIIVKQQKLYIPDKLVENTLKRIKSLNRDDLNDGEEINSIKGSIAHIQGIERPKAKRLQRQMACAIERLNAADTLPPHTF